MTDDNVVYLSGKKTAQKPDAPDEAERTLRGVFLHALKACRSGNVRAAIIITVEKDGITWRAGGNCSDFEFIAALESTKIDWMVGD